MVLHESQAKKASTVSDKNFRDTGLALPKAREQRNDSDDLSKNSYIISLAQWPVRASLVEIDLVLRFQIDFGHKFGA